jgi:hypothetical protein
MVSRKHRPLSGGPQQAGKLVIPERPLADALDLPLRQALSAPGVVLDQPSAARELPQRGERRQVLVGRPGVDPRAHEGGHAVVRGDALSDRFDGRRVPRGVQPYGQLGDRSLVVEDLPGLHVPLDQPVLDESGDRRLLPDSDLDQRLGSGFSLGAD